MGFKKIKKICQYILINTTNWTMEFLDVCFNIMRKTSNIYLTYQALNLMDLID